MLLGDSPQVITLTLLIYLIPSDSNWQWSGKGPHICCLLRDTSGSCHAARTTWAWHGGLPSLWCWGCRRGDAAEGSGVRRDGKRWRRPNVFSLFYPPEVPAVGGLHTGFNQRSDTVSPLCLKPHLLVVWEDGQLGDCVVQAKRGESQAEVRRMERRDR